MTTPKEQKEKKPFLAKMNDQWGPIAAITLLCWAILVMAWPKIKDKADIASKQEVAESVSILKERILLLETGTITSDKNQAISIVLLAELTGRITEDESKYRIIQIANGKYDQSELLNLLLAKPEGTP